jgi:hypothetical protein
MLFAGFFALLFATFTLSVHAEVVSERAQCGTTLLRKEW